MNKKKVDYKDYAGTIVFEEDLNRSAAYDGDRQIGECEYIIKGNTWSITHTGVREEYGGSPCRPPRCACRSISLRPV